MKAKEEIPRRNRMDKWSTAEKAIYDAIQEVEKMGCDIRLTEVVIKLSEAQNSIADYIDAEIIIIHIMDFDCGPL